MAEKKETAKKLNLAEKLIEVRKSIDVFVKDTKWHNYSYVSGTQVLAKIKDKMDELWVLLIPQIEWEPTYLKEWYDFIVSAKMLYIRRNASDTEIITVPRMLFGKQNDPSKAFWSWLTYSERYFLLKFFGVPTDDEDPDARQEVKQPAKQSVPVKTQTTVAPVVKTQPLKPAQTQTQSDKEDNEMADKVTYEQWVDFVNARLKELKAKAIETTTVITDRDIKEIAYWLQDILWWWITNPIYIKIRDALINPELIALSRNK